MLDAADRQTMLEAVGVTAAVTGGGTMLISPPEYDDPQVMYVDNDILNVNPFCQAASEDIAANGITGGESGSILTVDGHDWRVLAIKASSSGFVSIELGAV